MKTDLVQGTAISPSVAEINTTGRHLALFALIAIGEKSLEVDMEKGREFQKNIYFFFIDYAKAVDCGLQQTVENS